MFMFCVSLQNLAQNASVDVFLGILFIHLFFFTFLLDKKKSIKSNYTTFMRHGFVCLFDFLFLSGEKKIHA